MSVYFDYRVYQWGDLWNVYLKPMTDELEKQLTEYQKLLGVASKKISGEPLADVGKVRTISFNALDTNWSIYFNNTYVLNTIGEEFASILQVFLCEISRLGINVLQKEKNIEIVIDEGNQYERIKKQAQFDNWIASIPKLHSRVQDEIKYHYAYISIMIKQIFLSITVLNEQDFEEYWWKTLYEKERIADKALATNTYQKVYCNTVSEKAFDDSQKTAFNSLPAHTIFAQLPKLLI